MSETTYNKRADWKKHVSQDMTMYRKRILIRVSTTGQLSQDESNFLIRYDKATRVCNKCGKPVGTRLWSNRLFKTKSGETLPIGLSALCFNCELEEKMKSTL